MSARLPTLLAAAWIAAAAVVAPVAVRADGPRVVEVTARRFQFTPDEIHLRKGETVILRLRSEDVTHGFFERALGLDATISPGPPTEVRITPEAVGRHTVICDHFCGSGHGGMKMTIVVE